MRFVIGAYILLAIIFCGCGQEDNVSSGGSSSPVASFTVLPLTGQPDTVFAFDASTSSSRAERDLLFRWDWEEDGVWDTDFSAETSASHVYGSLGYKSIKLEAKDTIGLSRTTKQEVFITVASKEMILIPAGEFIMGSPEGVGNDDEYPQHAVYLDAFLIGKYEVTNTYYVEFLNAIGKNNDDDGHELVDLSKAAIRFKDETYKALKGWEDDPVVGVSWYGAKAYAEWADGRLPTEAEWEKAARGESGREWPWGELWELGKCNSWESGIHDPAAVGAYPTGISPYGVHDMAGNVYEWLADWYKNDYYKTSPQQNPMGPESGVFRVLRGGSWAEVGDKCRPAMRFGQRPDDGGDSDFGFRIVKDVE